MEGIYQYRDLETDNVVYVGKDSNIEKNTRHRHHLYPSQYDAQPFNRIIQNNPERYQYEVIYAGDFDEDLLNVLEINTIAEEDPIFNFTKGGDGCTGWIPSKETRIKIGDANRGRFPSEETRKKMGESHKGQTRSKETKKRMSDSQKGEKNHQWKGYHRIILKGKDKYGRQKYSIVNSDGKAIKHSVFHNKLIEWFNNNYPNTYLEY